MRHYKRGGGNPSAMHPVVGLVALAVIFSAAVYGSEATVNATVRRLERVTNQDESAYLVFTDAGVMKVADSLLYGRWNSSDVYGSLDVGKTYTFRTAGWRIPFLSVYPNIVEAKEVTK